jgi:hypothetical protein
MPVRPWEEPGRQKPNAPRPDPINERGGENDGYEEQAVGRGRAAQLDPIEAVRVAP